MNLEVGTAFLLLPLINNFYWQSESNFKHLIINQLWMNCSREKVLNYSFRGNLKLKASVSGHLL